MRKLFVGTALIGVIALVLCQTDLLWAGPSTQAEGSTATLAERVAVLEKKLANLERIMSLRLDDEKTVSATLRARDIASVMSQLQTLRSQLELYQVQHKGEYPDLSKGWGQLTRQTDMSGNVVSATSGRRGYGPYLQNPPTNPLTGSTRVISDPRQINNQAGWYYIQATGECRLVVSASDKQRYNLATADVAVYPD